MMPISERDLKRKASEHGIVPGTTTNIIRDWAENLITQCVSAFGQLLPFSDQEIAFLEALEKERSIRPELLSASSDFCYAVKHHPGLLWRIKQLEKQSHQRDK